MTADDYREYVALMRGDNVPDADGIRALLAPRPAWHADAACRGMDTALFFPERGQDTRSAKAICATCTVRDECRGYARSAGAQLIGIWAGTTGRDRRRGRTAA